MGEQEMRKAEEYTDDMKASMIRRIEYRETKLKQRMDRMRRYIEAGRVGGEENRVWLDQWAQKGVGLDVCCGDFLIGEAQGVDTTPEMLGQDFSLIEAEALVTYEPGELDFVVTNYLDIFPNPLKALQEWHRVLKVGGILGLVACDASKYPARQGPLRNHRRSSCFVPLTLKCYLERANFTVKVMEQDSTFIRCMATKNAD